MSLKDIFRSWHIVLVGIIFQTAFGSLLFSAEMKEFSGFILGMSVLFLLSLIIGVVPMVLLFFEQTRKAGAVISIVFGIIAIALQIGYIVGPFLIIAGILTFFKKL